MTLLLLTLLLTTAPESGDPIELESGLVFLPPEIARPPAGPPSVDLVLHLHGAVPVVQKAVADAGWNLPVLIFNRKGLSSVYTAPFQDPALLDTLVDRVRAALTRAVPDWRFSNRPRLLVSSFSAGFGGVREILKSPDHVDRISALVLADSLYCGYQSDDPALGLDPEKMAGFRAFAQLAARGEKSMLVSHSAQVPEGYASTTETADDLARTAGADFEAVHQDLGEQWKLSRRCRSGRLLILGFEGSGPEDHMRHLRQLGLLWKQLTPASSP